jgi:hypothetical protein
VGGDGELLVAGLDDEPLALLAQAGPERVDDELHEVRLLERDSGVPKSAFRPSELGSEFLFRNVRMAR